MKAFLTKQITHKNERKVKRKASQNNVCLDLIDTTKTQQHFALNSSKETTSFHCLISVQNTRVYMYSDYQNLIIELLCAQIGNNRLDFLMLFHGPKKQQRSKLAQNN